MISAYSWELVGKSNSEYRSDHRYNCATFFPRSSILSNGECVGEWSWSVQKVAWRGEQKLLFSVSEWDLNPNPFPVTVQWCADRHFDPRIDRRARIGSLRDWVRSPERIVAKEQLHLRPCRKHQVYFIQESGSGSIKIGTTIDVSSRLKGLLTSILYTLVVMATMDGNREAEQALHLRFAHARIRGEWFRPVPELLAYIATIKESRT